MVLNENHLQRVLRSYIDIITRGESTGLSTWTHRRLDRFNYQRWVQSESRQKSVVYIIMTSE